MMFKALITLLKQDNYYGISDSIDIAKGINKVPINYKEFKSIIKRKLWQLRK